MEPVANPIPVGATGKIQNNVVLPYEFTVGGLISESWKRVKGAKRTYWGATLVYLLLYALVLGIGFGAIQLHALFNPQLTNVKVIIAIIRIMVVFIILPLPFGITYLAALRSVNSPIRVGQMFRAYSFYWRIFSAIAIIYVGGILLVFATFFSATMMTLSLKAANLTTSWLYYVPTVICTVGALIIFYLFFSFSFAPLLIIEKKLGVFRALKTSFLGFKQHGWKIILTILCLCIIYFLGAIPLGIGLIWTLPLTYNGIGILYRIQFGVEGNN